MLFLFLVIACTHAFRITTPGTVMSMASRDTVLQTFHLLPRNKWFTTIGVRVSRGRSLIAYSAQEEKAILSAKKIEEFIKFRAWHQGTFTVWISKLKKLIFFYLIHVMIRCIGRYVEDDPRISVSKLKKKNLTYILYGIVLPHACTFPYNPDWNKKANMHLYLNITFEPLIKKLFWDHVWYHGDMTIRSAHSEYQWKIKGKKLYF